MALLRTGRPASVTLAAWKRRANWCASSLPRASFTGFSSKYYPVNIKAFPTDPCSPFFVYAANVARCLYNNFRSYLNPILVCVQNQQLSGFGVTPSRGMAARPAHNLPRPAFGSSPNLQALVLEAGERSDSQGQEGPDPQTAAFYEVTIASADQPKLLSRLSEALVPPPPPTGFLVTTMCMILLQVGTRYFASIVVLTIPYM